MTRGKRAIAALVAAFGLVTGLAAPAQAGAQARWFDCDWARAESNGYFYLDLYFTDIDDCIANAGYMGVDGYSYKRYWSGNNRGAIEVITESGVYYKQPFEKWTWRNLSPNDLVVSVTIF
ncbi:hypothetical protein JOF56_008740 [Kibdelosporangium banguiense]|uniref:Streptomyces killer toxin-like beta/gamma crystallin domain-containing protein n=1 Tax=Kibdelosporangium banguiense TaxID=1365924 RepID=A0ABS4TWK7_9PSEU|nr:hypothetical protein [Kibdelosporangium banguiense]MBP2328355.1 hypothetical protein [Kibdelosporangium banguiense]